MTVATHKISGSQETATCKSTSQKYDGCIVWEDVENGKLYIRRAGRCTRAFGRKPYVFCPICKEAVK